MLKPILPILAGLLLSTSVFAQGVALQSDHPETYTVVRGDTLWDIAERFLQNPWLWPEIWQANPQIENPHLIYPGDVIRLVYVDGEPRLRLERGERPIVKLSPTARATPLREAIQPINLNDIRKYFGKRTLVDHDSVGSMPYVVAMEEGRTVSYTGNRIYVRGLEGAEVGDTFAVVRPTLHYLEVPDTWPRRKEGLEPTTEPWGYPGNETLSDMTSRFWRDRIARRYYGDARSLGYEVIQTGIGEVTALGDPATLLITGSEAEIKEGDLVIPVFDADYDLEYMPHPPARVPSNMRVMAVTKSLFGAGPNEVVALSRGSADGVENGEVYAVFYEGDEVRDEVKHPKQAVKTFFSRNERRDAKVKLPDEYAAHVMIFKTYEHMSYALVMRTRRVVQVDNVLKAP